MKKGILKLTALLLFSAAVLQGCAIDKHGRRGHRGYDRNGYHSKYYNNGHNYDRDHQYNGYN